MAYKVIVSRETTEYWGNGELLDYINRDAELKNGEVVTSIIPISYDEYERAKKEANKKEENKDGATLVFEDEAGEEHAITIPNTNANFTLLLLCFKNNENLLDFVRVSGETLYDDGTRIDFTNDSFVCVAN